MSTKNPNQTKLGSFIESCINVGIGYVVAVLSQWIIFPLFDIEVGIGDSLGIAACFTVISLLRLYIVRRVFNRF